MKKVSKDLPTFEILKLLSYTTEISPKIISLLEIEGKNKKTYANTISEMKKINTYKSDCGEVVGPLRAVTTQGTGIHKTIRLTKDAYEKKLLRLVGEREQKNYERMIGENFNYSHNKMSIERNHLLSKTIFLMGKNDIECVSLEEIENLGKLPFFVKNIDIKRAFSSEAGHNSKAIHQGRTQGIFGIGGKYYNVYGFDSDTAKWSNENERRLISTTEYIIKKFLHPLSFDEKDEDCFNNGILIMDDFEILEKILIKNEDIIARESIKVFGVFNNFHFLWTERIDDILKLMKIEEYLEKLKMMTFSSHENIYTGLERDGITDNGEYLLFTFDLNMNRLIRFKKGAKNNQDKKFMVYGFDWQEKFLRSYFGENFKIATIKAERLFQLMEYEYEGI
ncbi:MAG: hypothetical protein ACRCU3_02725 [Eubacteriaceae bacterium]